MVNVKKQRQIKKKGLIIKKKSSFEKWLIDFFGTSRKTGYYKYWSGINGAINKKLNNWDPDNENWFERDGLYYACSNNEIMLPKSSFTFVGNKKMNNTVWDSTKVFLSDLDVDLNIAMFDVKTYFHNRLDVFKLFDQVKKYDILFFKNMTLELQNFLFDFGISECIDYIFFFLTEDDSNRVIEIAKEQGLSGKKHLSYNIEAKFLKENKIGFELYDNLKEWKKEVTAPTRNDPEYRRMKIRVRERDDFTCQCCGYRNTKKVNHGLEVHHIYGYKDHLDYRTEDSNCVTLCNDCHKKYHSVYGKNDVTPITFSKFIRDYNTYTNKSIQSTLD